MRNIVMAAMVLGLGITPLAAQTSKPTNKASSQAQCQANFKMADKDGNGTLNASEISASKKMVPTSLASMKSVSQAQFVKACTATTPKGG